MTGPESLGGCWRWRNATWGQVDRAVAVKTEHKWQSMSEVRETGAGRRRDVGGDGTYLAEWGGGTEEFGAAGSEGRQASFQMLALHLLPSKP